MLNQLIESKNTNEKNSRASFLVSTTVFVALFACCAMLWSLFAKDVVSANDSLEMSSLLPPVAIAPTEPPKPEPITKATTTKLQTNEVKLSVRNNVITRIDETPAIPDKVSTVQNTGKSRPNGAFIIRNGAEIDASNFSKGNRDESGTTIGTETPNRNNKKSVVVSDVTDKEEPPTRKTPIIAEVKPKVDSPKKLISLGVITGKATTLPKPIYSPAAKAIGASGAVNVQVLIDENGNVISAKATSGHIMLRANAESAARNAKFSPTLLSNQAVKVSGVIVYNFVK